MQILLCQNKNKQMLSKGVNFGCYTREVTKSAFQKLYKPGLHAVELFDCFESTSKNVLYKNNTMFMRLGFEWDKLAKFLGEFFEKIQKVNTYFYGCSDGEEVHSFIIAMNKSEKTPKTDKYKIIAKDIDETAINKAKKGLYNITFSEKQRINDISEGMFDKYYMKKGENVYSPTKDLKKQIIYEVANISEDYKNIEPDNSIVSARNFWPYFKMSERVKLAKNLYNQLGKNSMLIVGDFDLLNEEDKVEKILLGAGFKPTEMDYIYAK